MQAAALKPISIDCIHDLIEFCINEIALQGLEGCKITELYQLLYNSATVWRNVLDESVNSAPLQIHNFLHNLISTEDTILQNYLWKLLINQDDLDFYTLTNKTPQTSTQPSTKTTPKKAAPKKPSSLIINDNNNQIRGYSTTYATRTKVTQSLRSSPPNFSASLSEYSDALVLVASQEARSRVLCPSHKALDFENINDIEYCVLEAVARSRFDGVFTSGDDGLAKQFNQSSKQLHYTLMMLEGHGLIKKQVIKSAAQRTVIYLASYAFKNKTLVENICEYLMQKGENSSVLPYGDSFVSVKRRFSFSNKQFKTIVQHGERTGVFRRETMPVVVQAKCQGKWVSKERSMRVIRLTDAQIEAMCRSNTAESDETESGQQAVVEDEGGDKQCLVDCIGSEQVNTAPLHAQIMARIEASGREGISLRRLGVVFGLDFYKARRLGTNLQSHPDLVTIMKETTGGRAKFQSLVMRKLLKLAPSGGDCEAAMAQEAESVGVEQELVVIKRDNQTTKSIQALMTERTVSRKRIILGYLERNRICTKYELDKEIRSVEAENGLKGCIDSKTTKRMLLAMEKEKKLRTFNVCLKNVSYMGVRLYEIEDTDSAFINYCSTFKRTFDTVELKITTNIEGGVGNNNRSGQENDESVQDTELDDTEHNKTTTNEQIVYAETQSQFHLTRHFVNSIVSKLHFSTNNCKAYSLVPKFQKAIVLHRFLQYILFFYDGKSQDQFSHNQNPTDSIIKPREGEEQDATQNLIDSCRLPPANRTFQKFNIHSPDNIPWSSFIPPFDHQFKQTNSPQEKNCIFIGEIFSHMPLSVFCSLIAINHYVPGLVRLLKHPQKRHMLVKDLPAEFIAPLIFERRYLRRMLSILQILSCLGLVTFVNSPCMTNQALNRDIQSQMVYVHRQALFLDTSLNKATCWEELSRINKWNFDSLSGALGMKEESSNEKYEACLYRFNEDADVVEYWRRLLHVSMNTFKFSVQTYLHEDKRIRQEHLNSILGKYELKDIVDLWPIEKFGDHMGPGGYSSQIFLNTYKNWMLASNFGSADNRQGCTPSKQVITKEADLSRAPYSELALSFPFGLFTGIASSTISKSRTRKRKLPKANFNASDSELDEDNPDRAGSEKKIKKKLSTNKKNKPDNLAGAEQQSPKNSKKYKFIKARSLLDRARNFKTKTSFKTGNTNTTNTLLDRRAIWQSEEDEIILLIKVAALYFIPNEKCVPFKLISDVMNVLLPHKCGDKKIGSFGRRIKILLKSHMNLLFVMNKLELCKQSRQVQEKYAHIKLTRNTVDKEQVDLYLEFVNDAKKWFLGKKDYTDKDVDYDAEEDKFDLPESMEEFNKRFVIKNTPSEHVFSNQVYFKQPTSDYEISCNTLHSAIHSSILISDKNPRSYESFNLFDKYSDQLLTDVISKMSREHKIIAPTKCSELKKKNVTSFSKHIGKAFHISQRYQYKWTNNIASSVLDETHKFKESLLVHKNNSQADEMFDCTDNDDVGTTSFLAHTIEISDLQLQIDVPNKIWVSKLI